MRKECCVSRKERKEGKRGKANMGKVRLLFWNGIRDGKACYNYSSIAKSLEFSYASLYRKNNTY